MNKNLYISFHILEIRTRIFYILISSFFTFFTCYLFSSELLYILIRPFFFFEKNFIFTDLREVIFTYFKVYEIFFLLIMIPFFIYQIWCFFIPSVFLNKRLKINKILIVCIFYLVLISLILYFLFLPEICNLLLNFELNSELVTIKLQARIQPYIQLTFQLFLFVMFLLQSALFFYYLYENNKLACFFIIKYRKFYLLFCLVLGSLIAPPDILIQIFLTCSFFLSFECTFWFTFIKRNIIKKQFFE